MKTRIDELYGKRVRNRVCGLCWQDDALLMINHKGLYKHDFWAPPGGGIEFGEEAKMALEREFEEETKMKIAVHQFLFVCEMINERFHALEFFFAVNTISKEPSIGLDPELGKNQIISNLEFIQFRDVLKMPKKCRHGIFEVFSTIESLKMGSGYIKL